MRSCNIERDPMRRRAIRSILISLVLTSSAWSQGSDPAARQVDPVRIDEAITVTATRTEETLADTAASVTLLEKDELRDSAPTGLDEKLSRVPGFTLFRRSGSRFAHPTAQGVSLRGVGASGASRALVIDDGVPLNDPFGGWVYWNLVPLQSIDRVEILRGGASDLYGSGALSGVINLVRASASGPLLSIEASYGNDSTHTASVFAASRPDDLSWEASANRFGTDGYILVPSPNRGAVDVPSSSEQTSAELTMRWAKKSGPRWLARAGYYHEDRDNGTPLQENASTIRRGVAGADWNDAERSFVARLHLADLKFDSNFTAIAADRASERLTRIQHVPADSWGASASWSFRAGASHELTLGGEFRAVRGSTQESIVLPTTSIPTEAGGEQQISGLFAQDVIRLGAISATAGLRIDSWRNRDPFTIGGGLRSPLPSNDELELSPRVAILWRASEKIGITGSAYRSFRTPTLNELYRGFRVGNIVTDANPLLGPETLTGVEAGLNARISSRAFVRSRVFWNEIDDTVANVTLRATPGLIERQRRNLGTTRSTGLEVEAEARPLAGLRVSGSWLWTDAEVVAFEADRALEGKLLPQIPRHQATLVASFHAMTGTVVSGQIRWSDSQFDDDRNELPLAAFTTLDVYASHPAGPRFEIFLGAENLLNERFDIGRTPVSTVGPPRLLRAGLRFRQTRD
jgi:outer membrane receptor protein involved in Fe transport